MLPNRMRNIHIYIQGMLSSPVAGLGDYGELVMLFISTLLHTVQDGIQCLTVILSLQFEPGLQLSLEDIKFCNWSGAS